MIRLALSLLLLGATVTALGAPSTADLTRLKHQINEVHRELQSHRGERGKLQQQLRKAEVDIGELQTRIKANAAARDSLNARIKKLEARQHTLDEQQQRQASAIEKELASAYMQGRESKLKMLLNQRDPAALSRMMIYYRHFADARLARISQYRDTLEKLATVHDEIEQQRSALAAKTRQLAAHRDQLDSRQQQRRQAIAALDRTIAGKGQELKQLQRDRDHLQRLLDAVNETVDKIVPAADELSFAERRGRMTWPVAGRIVDHYGTRRDSGGLRWQGVVIAAAAGAPVRAVHPGRVVFANWFRGQGLLIIVDHGDGYLSLYAHNRSLLREVGDWVRAGEAIATVGDSGGQKRAALYFEIRHKGKPVNPGHWCHG